MGKVWHSSCLRSTRFWDKNKQVRRLLKAKRAKFQHLFRQNSYLLHVYNQNDRAGQSPVMRTASASVPGHSTHFAAHSTSAAKGDAENVFETEIWQSEESCFKVRFLPACIAWKETSLQCFLLGFYGRVLCQSHMLKHLILILFLADTSLSLCFENRPPVPSSNVPKTKISHTCTGCWGHS